MFLVSALLKEFLRIFSLVSARLLVLFVHNMKIPRIIRKLKNKRRKSAFSLIQGNKFKQLPQRTER